MHNTLSLETSLSLDSLPPRKPFRWICHGIALTAAFLLTTTQFLPMCGDAAADEVFVSPQEPGVQPRRLTGEILDYTGEILTLTTAAGGELSIPAERIQSIETMWTAAHREGDALLAENEFQAALDKYRIAAGEETRRWAVRSILSQAVWCYRNLGQIEQAGAMFLRIVEEDPATQYFDAIPLTWRPTRVSQSLEVQAERWLNEKEKPSAVLMGASWLLSGGKRTAALAALEELANTPSNKPSNKSSNKTDSPVAVLAEAQVWRTKLAGADSDIPRFAQLTRRTPPPLRAGPYYLYGRLLAKQEKYEEAALALMRVPILYPLHQDLSGAALIAAGRALENLGKTDQAAGLYREVVAQHPRDADEAKQRLEQIEASKR